MKEADFSSLIEQIYDAVFDPMVLPTTLQSISDGFLGVGTNIRDMRGNVPRITVSPSLQQALGDYMNRWWQFDTFSNYSRTQTAPGLYVESDLLSADFRSRDMYAQDFQRPHRIGEVMAYVLTDPDGGALSFCMMRDSEAGHISQDERERFTMLGRHVSRASALGVRLSRSEGIGRRLSDRLERFDCAVAVVNRDCRLIDGNALLHKLEGDGLRIRHGRLVHERPEAQTTLEDLVGRALATTIDGAPPESLPLPRAGSVLPMLVRAVTLQPGAAERAVGFAAANAVVLFILKPDLPGYPPLEQMLRSLGLTKRQAEFALAFGGGLTLKETSEHLRVGEETARTMLRHVYARFGINRQTQLAKLVARVALLRD